MKKTLTRLLLLFALAAAGSAWGFSLQELAELRKNEDYKENWELYQSLRERARTLMSEADLAAFRQREDAWLYGGAYDKEAREAVADGLNKVDAYASALAMHTDDAERLLDRAAVIRAGDGVSGLYRLKSGALEGELLVRAPEEGEYVVELILTMDGEPAGYFEGSARLNGKTLAAKGDLLVEEYDPEKDSAAVTLTFDSEGAAAVTTESFKRESHRKKWLDEGVVFDGAYARQSSVFGN